MKSQATTALLIQRTEWFDRTSNQDMLNALEGESQLIQEKLSSFLEITHHWTITTPESAVAARQGLAKVDVDLVLLVVQTRIEQDILEEIAAGINSHALVVWGYAPWRRIPQPVSYESLVRGGSFPGTTAFLAGLHSASVPFLSVFGAADDPSVLQSLECYARAAQTSHRLKRLRIGIIPNPNTGGVGETGPFTNCLGADITDIEIAQLSEIVPKISEKAIDDERASLQNSGVEVMVTDETLRLAIRNALALNSLSAANKLDYLALSAHNPRYRRQFHLCAGLPIDRAQSEPTNYIPTLNGAAVAAHIILREIGNSPVFLMSIWFWDRARNIVIGGHGGMQSPAGIAAGPITVCGDYECAREDPDGGAQMEFVARPGRVTLLQLMDNGQGCRALACTGFCLESDPRVEGSPQAVVRLDSSIDTFLTEMAHSGASAYWSMSYGDHIAGLKAFCAFKSIPFSVLGL